MTTDNLFKIFLFYTGLSSLNTNNETRNIVGRAKMNSRIFVELRAEYDLWCAVSISFVMLLDENKSMGAFTSKFL